MKKSIVVICLLSVIITGCGDKNVNTYKVENGVEKRTSEVNYTIDQNTFKTSEVQIVDGGVTGKVLNDDDYDRDINMTVNYSYGDNKIGSEKFTVADVYVGATKSFKFVIGAKYTSTDRCTITVDSVRKLVFTPQ